MRLTPRGWGMAAVCLLFYFFSNQTQVGWLYVFSALTAGLWLAALLVPRRALARLQLSRRINGSTAFPAPEIHAGETLTIELEVHNPARLPALQVRGLETCPPAAPGERTLPFFLPAVPACGMSRLAYSIACACRGWHEFPPIHLTTRAPFGFFAWRREAPAAAGVLVFPEWREIDRMPFFDRRPAAETAFSRLGQGGEFVGVREYRPGDPRRHVHWRTTARAGRLIVREFAEETQPGLTIALDLRAASAIGPEGDDTLELAIKLAATLARYAGGRGLPVTLVANSDRWPVPPGPLSEWGLMNYLARVQAGGDQPLAQALRGLYATSFVAAILPAPDPGVVGPLLDLQRAGLGVLAVLVDPAPFGASAAQAAAAREVAGALRAGQVAVRVVGREPDWERALAWEGGMG